MSVPQSVLDLVSSSGNNFHAKVARWFTEQGWSISVSPYYMDQSQGKARELDLITERCWPLRSAYGDFAGHVVVRLFVECKFIASEVAFWFAPRDPSSVARALAAVSSLFDDVTHLYVRRHHYLSRKPDRVAKLFASTKDKQIENDPIYKALNQVLNGTVSLGPRPYLSPELVDSRGQIYVMSLPVVLCHSFAQFYSVDFLSSTSTPTPIVNNFLFDVSYAYMDQEGKQRNRQFAVDFVSFEKLEVFAKELEEDAKAAVQLAQVQMRRLPRS